MSDWTSGYVADIGYTYGYYNELNPHRATLALLNAGFVPPPNGVHCEMGYGQGLSVNVHSAATGTTWYGTDFNPSQAAFAQSLASASGADANLTDESFADFCNRNDLPDFDSIGLHGIWSWISDENRTIIVDFIRRKLKVGGALYLSYNTLPGWATFAPIRHLLSEHATVMGAPGDGVVGRIDEALEFARRLFETNPAFIRANPNAAERFNKVSVQDRNYLAHEYFNKDWHPMHFGTLNKWLAPSKVTFACSAHYLDHIDVINLTIEQQNLLQTILDPVFKQSVRDFMVNQQFRRDYWIKGARKLTLSQQSELLKQHQMILINPVDKILLTVSGALGEANLNKESYEPILDLMADHQARTIGEIAEKLKIKGVTFPQIVQALIVLAGAGHLASVQANEFIQTAKKQSEKLNSYIINLSKSSSEIACLASPVIGGGILANRIEQLFILAISENKNKINEWVDSTWKILSEQNQRVLKDGKPMESVEENLNELKRLALEFSAKRLPILKQLQII